MTFALDTTNEHAADAGIAEQLLLPDNRAAIETAVGIEGCRGRSKQAAIGLRVHASVGIAQATAGTLVSAAVAPRPWLRSRSRRPARLARRAARRTNAPILAAIGLASRE